MSDAPRSDLARRAAELRDHFHSPFDLDGFKTKPPHVQRRFERRLRLLPIPADLSGKTVLDVGAWDGFFSFEFERRGVKRVLAIDAWGGFERWAMRLTSSASRRRRRGSTGASPDGSR